MVGEPSIAILTVRDSDLLLTSFVQVIVKEEQRCTKDVVVHVDRAVGEDNAKWYLRHISLL